MTFQSISLAHAFTNDNSHKTAIKRKGLSNPTRYLLNNGYLVGKVLDYGCGYGTDADILSSKYHIKTDKYDPYWWPYAIKERDYDVIFCNYVLNVIPDESCRQIVIKAIKDYLKSDGTAYISVRNDIRELRGWTRHGTWQGLISLNYHIVHKTNNYIMYRMHKHESYV